MKRHKCEEREEREEREYYFENGISITLQMLGVVVGIFVILGMLIVNTNTEEAKVKQRLINEAFNTEYTLDEVYGAKDVIFLIEVYGAKDVTLLIERNTDLDN